MTYAFQFQFIFKIRIFTFFNFSIFTEFSLPLHKLGFFRFLRRHEFRNISTKILLLLCLFSFVIYSNIFVFFLLSAFLPITKITFVLFHGFNQTTNVSCMTILGVVWLFTFWLFYVFPLIFYLKNFIQLFSYKSFSGVENVIPILLTSISQWASLSLD